MLDKNHFDKEDPIWKTHMQTLMKRKRNMEVAQIIDEAINEWYSLHDQPVPKWKRKDPDWWIEYLIRLGMDPNNP